MKPNKIIQSFLFMSLSALSVLISCSNEFVPTPVDYTRYFPMHLGDSMVYLVHEFGDRDSLEYWKCFGTTTINSLQYYEYKVLYPKQNDDSTQRIDTFLLRQSTYGDVYSYYIDTEYFWYDFHTDFDPSQLNSTAKVSEMFISCTTTLGSFDSCISFLYRPSSEKIYKKILAPNVGLISQQGTSGDRTLIHADIDTFTFNP
jgi:hypothetical protein